MLKELVEAEISSIAKEQPCLVHVRNVACWIIHRCMNCCIDTHALHRDRGAACVLINTNTLVRQEFLCILKFILTSPVCNPVLLDLIFTEW